MIYCRTPGLVPDQLVSHVKYLSEWRATELDERLGGVEISDVLYGRSSCDNNLPLWASASDDYMSFYIFKPAVGAWTEAIFCPSQPEDTLKVKGVLKVDTRSIENTQGRGVEGVFMRDFEGCVTLIAVIKHDSVVWDCFCILHAGWNLSRWQDAFKPTGPSSKSFITSRRKFATILLDSYNERCYTVP